MTTIRVWALESDYDKAAVQRISEKIATHYGSNVTVVSAGKSSLSAVAKQPNGLERAVTNYLKQDHRLVFILDADGPATLAQRRHQPNSLINQATSLLRKPQFEGKLFLVLIEYELEAWLLIDCAGIAGFFVKDYLKLTPENCHARINEKIDLLRLISKRQSGDTTRFVESFPGERSAKEEIKSFSVDVLRATNPKLKPSDLSAKSYTEAMAPAICDYVRIADDTIRRNRSLLQLAELILETR